MGSPMGSFLDSGSERGLESDSEESQSESTQVEEDLALLDVVVSAARKSGTNNFNHKRQRTSATASPGSSTPESDESHAEFDGEEEGLTAKAHYVETLEKMWERKKEFETFKENRKKERHDQIMELERRKIDLKENFLELRQLSHEHTVMSTNISGMSEQQQKYFLSLQDEIFARRFGAGSG